MKPATPLPWKAAPTRVNRMTEWIIFYPNAANEPRGDCHVGKLARTNYSDKNAAYLVHAANAYPKLVEALRSAGARIEEMEKMLSGSDGWKEAEGRALLRELGEDA